MYKPIFDSIHNARIAEYLVYKGVKRPYDFATAHGEVDFKEDEFKSAVDAVKKAKESGRQIVTVIDSDLDGYTSASIVTTALKEFGVSCKLILHEKKQHGVVDVLDDIPDGCLLIVPDASIENDILVGLLERNVDSITLDHHDIIDENNHASEERAVVINNGNEPQSGAVVAMKFAKNLLGEIDGYYYTLAMLGNAADVMSQNYQESRIINVNGYNLDHKFIKELFNNLKEYPEEKMSIEAIGWKIAPKCNAVIRSTDMEMKKELFTALCTCEYESDFIERMKSLHEKQKRKVKSVAESLDVDNTHNIIIADIPEVEGIVGVNGLIAGRLSSKYNKPVFAVKEGNNSILSGSARSPINIRELCEASNLFSKSAGHAQAFGVEFSRDDVPMIYNFFDSINLGDTEEVEVLCITPPRLITQRFIRDFADNDFYGKDVERPLVYIKPFTMNLKDIKFVNKFKTSIAIEINNDDDERYDIRYDFISKIKRLELGLGEDKRCKVSFLAKPKMKYNDKTPIYFMQVEEMFVEEIKEEVDW